MMTELMVSDNGLRKNQLQYQIWFSTWPEAVKTTSLTPAFKLDPSSPTADNEGDEQAQHEEGCIGDEEL